MKVGVLVSVVVTLLAICGMVAAFLSSASPYVTVAEAREMKGDRLHIVGTVDKGTLASDLRAREVRFALTDEKGERIDVVYSGPPPSNMDRASKIVVIGGVRDGQFLAHDLLLKCPSKYEGTPK